jgi:hypothetical protein
MKPLKLNVFYLLARFKSFKHTASQFIGINMSVKKWTVYGNQVEKSVWSESSKTERDTMSVGRSAVLRDLMLYGLRIILQCMCSPTDTQYSCITKFIHESMCSTMFRTSRVHPQERPSCLCRFGKW